MDTLPNAYCLHVFLLTLVDTELDIAVGPGAARRGAWGDGEGRLQRVPVKFIIFEKKTQMRGTPKKQYL